MAIVYYFSPFSGLSRLRRLLLCCEGLGPGGFLGLHLLSWAGRPGSLSFIDGYWCPSGGEFGLQVIR